MTNEQMPRTMDEVLNPRDPSQRDPAFPDAPLDWNRQQALDYARDAGLELADIHWELVRALQHYFKRHEGQTIKRRELHDALDEHFHVKGGLKHLYELMPAGPVATGCRLAGLEPPAGSTDKGFGSAV